MFFKTRRQHATTSIPRRKVKRLLFAKDGQTPTINENVARALGWYHVAGAYAPARIQRLVAQAQLLTARAAHQRADLKTATTDLVRTRRDHEAALTRSNDVGRPVLSVRAVIAIFSLGFLGDLVITSAAIMSTEASTNFVVALTSSFAIALALMVTGKIAGEALRESLAKGGHEGGGAEKPKDPAMMLLAGAGIVLLAISIGLMMLRLHTVWAWFILSLAPAVLGAGATLLGEDKMQRTARHELTRASAARAAAEHKHEHSKNALARTDEELGQVDGLLSSWFVATLTAQERALASLAAGKPGDPVTNPRPLIGEDVQSVVESADALGAPIPRRRFESDLDHLDSLDDPTVSTTRDDRAHPIKHNGDLHITIDPPVLPVASTNGSGSGIK